MGLRMMRGSRNLAGTMFACQGDIVAVVRRSKSRAVVTITKSCSWLRMMSLFIVQARRYS